MASKLQVHRARYTPASTTDAVTWVTIAYYTLSDNAAFDITRVWVLGKDGAGNIAKAQGTHAGLRAAGTISAVGSLIDLVTMLLGSSAALNTSAYRINISGDDIQLQVKGVAATTIEWFGGFEIKVH